MFPSWHRIYWRPISTTHVPSSIWENGPRCYRHVIWIETKPPTRIQTWKFLGKSHTQEMWGRPIVEDVSRKWNGNGTEKSVAGTHWLTTQTQVFFRWKSKSKSRIWFLKWAEKRRWEEEKTIKRFVTGVLTVRPRELSVDSFVPMATKVQASGKEGPLREKKTNSAAH